MPQLRPQAVKAEQVSKDPKFTSNLTVVSQSTHTHPSDPTASGGMK